MRISVIIPAFDAARYLRDAIDSVLLQTRRADELIVVDDGSSDATAEIARSCASVELIRQARRGVAAARNRGVAAATGDWLAFLDADDRWLPHKLSSYVSTGLDAAMIGEVEFRLEPGSAVPAGFRVELLQSSRVAPIPTTLVVSRHAFDAIGDFDESLVTAEDVEWFSRAASCGYRPRAVEGVTAIKRIHDASLSSTQRQPFDLFTALRKRLAQRPSGPHSGGGDGLDGAALARARQGEGPC